MSAAAIEALIILAAKYGPELIFAIAEQFRRLQAGQTVTIEDVEAAFKGLKPYAAYGIPEKVVGVPATVLPVVEG